MNKTCTLEQAKRLKELAVDQKSERRFCEIGENGMITTTQHIFFVSEQSSHEFAFVKGDVVIGEYAAFDTDELLAMLPEGYSLEKLGQNTCRVTLDKIGSYLASNYAAHALASVVLRNLETSYPEFSATEINERIKQYNNVNT